MDSNNSGLLFAFLGAFVSLFGAGYVVGLNDRDSKALADLYQNIETLPNGAAVTFSYRCHYSTDNAQVGIREVTYDPVNATEVENQQPIISFAMQRYLIGRLTRMPLPVSKEAITALVGGASGGLTLKTIGQVASDVRLNSSMSRFAWRQLSLRAKAVFVAGKTQRIGAMVLGVVSGYSFGYALATRQPRCEAESALTRIQTKAFWKDFEKHYTIIAVASVWDDVNQCPSARFQSLLKQMEASTFQPTPADLAYVYALAAEVECSVRSGTWTVPAEMCRGAVMDMMYSDLLHPKTHIDVCSALSDDMPPDVTAWHTISKDCIKYQAQYDPDGCADFVPLCGVENPRYNYLTRRYAQDPVALHQIEAGLPDTSACPGKPSVLTQ
jgi:hypothetical protein